MDEKASLLSNQTKKSGLEKSHLCGRMMFFWVNSLINLGRKQYLEQSDIFELRDQDQCAYNYQALKQNWNAVLNENKFPNPLKEAMWRTFKRQIIWLSVLNYFSQIIALTQALSTGILLDALKNDILEKLLIGMAMLLFSIVVSNVFKNWYQFQYNLYLVQSSGALNMLIVNQTLNFPLIRSSFYQLGDFLNMIQVDINQIASFFQYYILIFITPILLIFTMTVSFLSLGSLFIIPAVGSIIQVLMGLILGVIYGRLQRKFMHGKDLRMRYLDEMMIGIKPIKYNSMETFFQNRIREKRDYELKRLFREKLMTLVIGLVNGMMSLLSIALTCTFNQIDGSQFLFILSLTSVISVSISSLPDYITTLVVGFNSIKRTQPFLLAEQALRLKNVSEQDSNNVYENKDQSQSNQFLGMSSNFNDDQGKAIIVNNGNFRWLEAVKMSDVEEGRNLNKQEKSSFIAEKFEIQDLNFNIQKGQCVAFVGDVGSGQSSIMYSLIGEMIPVGEQGTYNLMVKMNGSISVACQEPWIMQGTVKENITFGQEFNSSQYRQVLRFSGLEHDLRQFPDSDMTVIGEKGDTISGGQKKRINLARTLYNDADIYLLDDPLSALDVKVASYVMREGILGYLSKKTRVIFSGSLDHLQKVDRIYYIEQGKIQNIGSLQQIKVENFGGDQVSRIEQQSDPPIVSAESNRQLSERFVTQKQPTDIQSFLLNEDKQNGSVNRQIHVQLWIRYGHFFTLSFLILTFILNLLIFRYAMSNFNQFNDLDDKIEKEVKEEIREQGQVTPEEYQLYKQYEIQYSLGLSCLSIPTLLNGLLIFTISIRLSRSLHDNVVIRLLKASFTQFYNVILKGRLLNRLSKDIFNVDSQLPQAFLGLSNGIFFFLQFAIYFFMSGQYLMYPLFLVQFVVSFYIVYLYMRSMREIVRVEAVSKSPILSFYTEIVRGAIYLRNCVSRTFLMECHAERVENDLKNQISLMGVNCWFNLVISIINMTSVALFMLIAFFDPEKQSSDITALVVLTSNVAVSFVLISTSLTNYEVYMINFERCLYLQNDVPIEVEKAEKNIYAKKNYQNNQIVDQEHQISADSQNSPVIQFSNTSLRYRDNIPPVLTKIDLKIMPKEKIGIIGRTGAGKTSLTLGLARIIEIVEGTILLQDKDIRNYDLNELRNSFSVIPQDPFIFQGTLRENLDPKKEHTDADLLNVMKETGLDKCSSFRAKLQSQISQLGGNLSAGQKQLVSIACALLQESKIIMIDEASATMDEESQEKVMNAINNSFKNCTVITIAHKIKTILKSDQIAVIDSGAVLEYDTPQNLMADPQSVFSSVLEAMQKSCGVYG